ncbi:MAG: DNA polymerase I [Acidimicrobiales bacterium]
MATTAPTSRKKKAKATAAPTRAGPSGPLLLLDGMSLGFRAYFALPNTLITSSGTVTNAVHGFTSMVSYLIREHHPSGIAVAFDLPGETFRDEIVEDYKEGRAAAPPDLTPQFDLIRAVLESLAIPVIGVEGFEADDVLATLATEARDNQLPVIIVTGDRDSYQLVEDPFIRVLYNKKGVSDYALYDEAGIEARTGVRPEKYPLLAALRGDPSDNLPGVPGVGEKTAAKLINEYGDLDAVYAHLDALTPKLRENLAAHFDQVRKNAEVIPLVRDVPLDVHVTDLRLGGFDPEEARDTFTQLELRTLWTRFTALVSEGYFGDTPAPLAGDSPGAAGALAEAAPEWLEEPKLVVPATSAEAKEALETLFADVRSGTGNVAIGAAWTGDPGRSSLASLTLTPEPADGEQSGTVLHLGTGAEGGSLATEPSVSSVLAAGIGGDLGVIAHDAKEIMRTLLPLGIDLRRLVMDTAVAAYLLDPSTERYRVSDLAARFLGVEVDDGDGGSGQGVLALAEASSETADADVEAVDADARRGARLVSSVARLRAPLLAALGATGESELFDDVERPLVRVLAQMEVTGIAVDQSVLRSIGAELAEECNSLEATIHDLAGGPFKVNSVPQLREVLYERLALNPVRKTKTGFSTDARTLELLRGEHPIIEALLRYREIEKLRSTYGESLAQEVADDGRIHATFRQTVARTGRLSSDRPNLHNIPVRTDEGRRFREAFVPSEGRRLLVADYDQVELRAIAHLSGDPGLTAAFAAGEDIHRTVAARVFGVDRDAVTGAQRSTAKMVSYGLAYGMEAYGLSQRLAVPVEQAQEILTAYFAGFPSVREYMDRAVADARAAGYTVTAFGRRRPLPDLASTNYQLRQAAERQAMNAGIQGLAADLFKIALVRLDEGLESGGFASGLVLQVHDEVLLDVVPDESDEVAALTEEAMTGAADLDVPLKVAMAWGTSWADAKAS